MSAARTWRPDRRRLLAGIAAGAALTASGCAGSNRASSPPIIVIGGGFAGATCARFLRRAAPAADITLITGSQQYLACPLSNLVLTGDRQLSQQTFDYRQLAREGIRLITAAARDVDPVAGVVTLAGGNRLKYVRLVLAPGIEFNWEALPGYNPAVAGRMPHAWQAGPQTLLLRRQLQSMRDGGLVVISIPENPYRCPPGPYERASLIAHYLKTHKPRSKLLILDAKDSFSKQRLFQAAWAERYRGILTWQGRADGASVVRVDAARQTLHTDFDVIRADVANVIPPQRAGRIAQRAGVTDASGWCPVQPLDFASTLQDNIHVIGDAAIANAMPKSAFAANAQAKLCAVQIARMLRGLPPAATTLINTCYSLVAPDAAISIAGVYQAGTEAWEPVTGSGGVSPLNASAAVQAQEARFAADWFRTITRETFG